MMKMATAFIEKDGLWIINLNSVCNCCLADLPIPLDHLVFYTHNYLFFIHV